MNDPTGRRLGLLRERLVREHLDALLATALPNVRYLSSFSGSNAILVVSAADAELLTDFRYKTQARAECPASIGVRIEAASLWTGVWHTFTELGA